MFSLALIYEIGQGVNPDINEAVTWYRRAADLGDQNAAMKIRELGFEF